MFVLGIPGIFIAAGIIILTMYTLTNAINGHNKKKNNGENNA